MRKLLLFTGMVLLVLSCKNDKKPISVTYPETRKTDTVDTYFGTEVPDPYRWLEDDRSPETENWVGRQNEATQSYLAQIPYREELGQRLQRLWDYEKVSSPFREGAYTYYYKNDGLQNQYVVYREKGDGTSEIFLDPNTFSEDGTTSLSTLSFTKDGSLAAYLISEGGSDWRKAVVLDTESLEVVEDTLINIKFSGIAWKGNEGFFYSAYDKPDGSELSEKTDHHKVYFHKLGTPQSEDKLIYGGKPSEKHLYILASITEDERYLSVHPANSSAGNKLLVMDLHDPNSTLIPVLDHDESETRIIASQGNTLFLLTNLNAPKQKIVRTDISNPEPGTWADVIPETEHVLNPSTGGGYIFAEYMIDALSKVFQYDYDGRLIREIVLPEIGSASGFNGKLEEKTLYYTFTNYKTPTTIYSLDAQSGKSNIHWAPEIDFQPREYESRQVFYPSKDGTRIPMIITHKKGIRLNGKNPTILYGYGGFNVNLTPSFSVVNAVWMEMGGVYAVPNIRGGGEYGKAWHDAGTKTNKQNVFDDFIAAAEFLNNEGYSSPEYLAIRGGSNGGLLVGAVMTQRPDLMSVALPAVGVLDMLRYHTFTIGAAWAYDYGTSDESEEMFRYLLGYSPLHNVKEGVAYPATLITTADHDDRVVPAHSFKFAAELQAKQGSEMPVLIRIETKAGHGAGTPVRKIIDQYADIFAFTFYNMGFQSLPEVETQRQIKG